MTERLSFSNYQPNHLHEELYGQWADTHAGLLITGNIMIERTHLESAGNVVLDDEADLEKFSKWTEVSRKNGNHIWAQISHSGRQTTRFIRLKPKSASEIQLKKMGLFGKPVALTEDEIEHLIQKFIRASAKAKEAGFTGVQIHAAHGYLISQFLSPITNLRTDQWGGSIENRSRLLKLVIQGIRQINGYDFPISVKLNSADFQKGGFTEDDSLWVIKMLEEERIDLLEISGGTYEKLAFFDKSILMKESTKIREAFFMDFAERLRKDSTIPLMVTGGFRSTDFMTQVIEENQLDVVGLARPFINDLDRVNAVLKGTEEVLRSPVIRASIGLLDDSAEGGYYARQIFRMAKGKPINENYSGNSSSLWLIFTELSKALSKKLN